jgi:hypothetical protein
VARDTRQHFRPNFFSVLKSKNVIGTSLFDKNAVRSALPRDAPSCSLQGRK